MEGAATTTPTPIALIASLAVRVASIGAADADDPFGPGKTGTFTVDRSRVTLTEAMVAAGAQCPELAYIVADTGARADVILGAESAETVVPHLALLYGADCVLSDGIWVVDGRGASPAGVPAVVAAAFPEGSATRALLANGGSAPGIPSLHDVQVQLLARVGRPAGVSQGMFQARSLVLPPDDPLHDLARGHILWNQVAEFADDPERRPNACEAAAAHVIESLGRLGAATVEARRQGPPPPWYYGPCPYLHMLRSPLSLQSRGTLTEVVAAFSAASAVPVTVPHRDTQPSVAVHVRDMPAMSVLRALCAAAGEPPPSDCDAEQIELGHGIAVSAFFARLTVATRLALLRSDPVAGEAYHVWTLPDLLRVVEAWVAHPRVPIQAGFCYAYDGDIMGFLYADAGRPMELGVVLGGDAPGGAIGPQPESAERRWAESRLTLRFPGPGGPLWASRATFPGGTGWALPFGAGQPVAGAGSAAARGGGDAAAVAGADRSR